MSSPFLSLARKLSGYQILEELESKFNGKIKVIREFGKIRVEIAGLTQSGDPIELVWKKPLLQIKSAHRVLILGLGAGTLANMVKQKFPESQITAVEVDPTMVEIGNKYFSLGQISNLTISVSDAAKFVEKSHPGQNYDTIFIDLYAGSRVPEQTDTSKFFASVIRFLAPRGKLFVNRLYYNQQTRMTASQTVETLEKLNAGEIKLIRTYTNLIIYLSHSGGMSDKKL